MSQVRLDLFPLLVFQFLPVRSKRLSKSNNLNKNIEIHDLEQVAQEDGQETVISNGNTANGLHQNRGDRFRSGSDFHWKS